MSDKVNEETEIFTTNENTDELDAGESGTEFENAREKSKEQEGIVYGVEKEESEGSVMTMTEKETKEMDLLCPCSKTANAISCCEISSANKSEEGPIQTHNEEESYTIKESENIDFSCEVLDDEIEEAENVIDAVKHSLAFREPIAEQVFESKGRKRKQKKKVVVIKKFDSVEDSSVPCKKRRKSKKFPDVDNEASQHHKDQSISERPSETSSKHYSSLNEKSPKVRRSQRIGNEYGKMRKQFFPRIKARGHIKNKVHRGTLLRIQSSERIISSSEGSSLLTIETSGSSEMPNDPSPPRSGRLDSAYATEVRPDIYIHSAMTDDLNKKTTGLYSLLFCGKKVEGLLNLYQRIDMYLL